MSGTLDVMILEKAVEMWRDPAKRGRIHLKHYSTGRMCALGVLIEAEWLVTGNNAGMSRAAKRLGYIEGWDGSNRVSTINDIIPGGQTYLYWRMKRALRKARR
jgi:hypothetical protein